LLQALRHHGLFKTAGSGVARALAVSHTSFNNPKATEDEGGL
jgi:hypothetical protein